MIDLFLKACAVAALLIGISCCSDGHSAAERSFLNPDSAVEPQAVEIARANNPTQAADKLIGWISETDISNRDFVISVSEAIALAYLGDSVSENYHLFIQELEEAKDALPAEKQAHLFVVIATPEKLGYLLRDDAQASVLVPLIEKEYASDSVSLSIFRKAYNK